MTSSPPLQDTPDFLKGRTHFSTGQCCREGVVTDRDSLLCIVHIHLLKAEISEHTAWREKKAHCFPTVITSYRSVCKCSNHHCCWSLWNHSARTDSLPSRKGGTYAGTAGWQVVRHWVLDHPQKLLRTICSPDTQLVQQLD